MITRKMTIIFTSGQSVEFGFEGETNGLIAMDQLARDIDLGKVLSFRYGEGNEQTTIINIKHIACVTFTKVENNG